MKMPVFFCKTAWSACGLICLLAAAPSGKAGAWYVATNGADSGHDGQSWAQAFLTISNAVTNASSAAADTIWVSNGVYTLNAKITVTKPVTIRGVNGWTNTVVNGNGSVPCFQLNHTSAVLRALTVSNGFSKTENGAGVQLAKGTVDDCLIIGNTVVSNKIGGGVFMSGNLTVVTNCRIYMNSAARGGGVGVDDNWTKTISAFIDNCDISSNRAEIPVTGATSEPDGGGIHAYTCKQITVKNCRIAYNSSDGAARADKSARGGGVGIYNYHDATLFENCEIIGNVVSNTLNVCGGGGFHTSGTSNIIRNCVISGNRCLLAAAWGGGILFDSANATNLIESCTVVGNYATASGNGIYLLGNGSDEVWNSVVYSNGAGANWYFGNAARTNYVHYTCTPDRVGGSGNTTNNPRFINYAAGDYRLQSGSPCLNAGTNRPWMQSVPDRDGLIRVRYGTVDMGAYEFVYEGTIYMFH